MTHIAEIDPEHRQRTDMPCCGLDSIYHLKYDFHQWHGRKSELRMNLPEDLDHSTYAATDMFSERFANVALMFLKSLGHVIIHASSVITSHNI